MSQGNTVRLHRVLATKPEKVFRAFLDADAMAKWLPPYGFTCKVHHMEAKVGGTFRMSFTNFSTGNGHSFGGEYLEIVPNERIRYTDRFDDPNLPGVIEVTVTLEGGLLRHRDQHRAGQHCRRRFRSRPAISAGSSRSPSLRWSWSRTFRDSDDQRRRH